MNSICFQSKRQTFSSQSHKAISHITDMQNQIQNKAEEMEMHIQSLKSTIQERARALHQQIDIEHQMLNGSIDNFYNPKLKSLKMSYNALQSQKENLETSNQSSSLLENDTR